MRVRVGCEFAHDVGEATHAVVQVEPRFDGDFSIIEERWEATPAVSSSRYIDGFGNLCRRLTIPPGRSSMRYDATVDVQPIADPADLAAVQHAPEDLPHDTLVYTLPSRFCPSDQLGAQAWDLFGGGPSGWARVQAVCDWVHSSITFGYGTSSPVTTAADVLAAGQGVCRDFAHVAVSLCRALNIPARYVFGYLPDIAVPPDPAPMDFCAWMEVYLGGRWWTFDPRNNARRIGRVLIGRGRDALDVAMVSTFGPSTLLEMQVWADEVTA